MGKHLLRWGAWGILVLAGCPDDEGGGNSVGPVPEDRAPETAVDVICGQFESCDCDPANKAPEGCEAQIDEQMRQALGDATAAGLEYDAACLGRLLSSVRDVGCRDLTDFTLEELVEIAAQYQCKVFNGTASPGEECEELSDLGDSCTASAECVDGLCVAIPEPVAEGEACELDLDVLSICEPGTYCIDVDDDDQPRCVRIPGNGDACLGASQLCNTGLACVDGTCVTAPGEGEACHLGGGSPCAEGLQCNFETTTCEPLPTGGEACFFACADGFECNDGRCEALEPLVCDVQIYDPEGN